MQTDGVRAFLFIVVAASISSSGCSGGSGTSEETEASSESENLGDLAEAPSEATTQAEAVAIERPEQADLILRRPALPDAFQEPIAVADGQRWANAFQFNASVYEEARAGAEVIGIVRRGTAIPVEGRVFGNGCDGRWYRVAGGFICTGDGFLVEDEPRTTDQRDAVFDEPMPYAYAQVSRRDGALRYFRPPTGAEETEIARAITEPDSHALPEVVSMQMRGDFFVALDREEESGWHRTIRGRYVHEDELTMLTTPQLVGAHLNEELSLPLAFVFAEDRVLYRLSADGAVAAGTAQKYARFHVERFESRAGVEYAVGENNLAVRRDEVRLARRSAPDERIGGTRWIHVDLAEQILIAYEDSEPIYATMVASGREGYDTPRGVFQIREKYVSTTMDGSDPVDGDFEVEEVPWTMFYWRSFALHGAYWHDDFGQVRSHGCTNIAPADAHWLFDWSGPHLPAGWHGYRMKRRGTWVWLTRGDADYDSES